MNLRPNRPASALGLILALLAGCDRSAPAPEAPEVASSATPALGSELEQYSYAVGTRLGEALLEQGLEVDQGAFVLALTDVLSHTPSRLSEEDRIAALEHRQEQVRQDMQREAEDNLTRSKQFLDKNRAEQGVVQTDSGLQYKVLASGSGAKPAAGDDVTVHYTGTLLDGTEFDSSRRRNEPLTFATTNVIPGWQEALMLMHVGDHWQVFIPPDLAYGERGAGGAIGPNQALIFDIELLEVKAAASGD